MSRALVLTTQKRRRRGEVNGYRRMIVVDVFLLSSTFRTNVGLQVAWVLADRDWGEWKFSVEFKSSWIGVTKQQQAGDGVMWVSSCYFTPNISHGLCDVFYVTCWVVYVTPIGYFVHLFGTFCDSWRVFYGILVFARVLWIFYAGRVQMVLWGSNVG